MITVATDTIKSFVERLITERDTAIARAEDAELRLMAAVLAENEACAKLAEIEKNHHMGSPMRIAAAIRGRHKGEGK